MSIGSVGFRLPSQAKSGNGRNHTHEDSSLSLQSRSRSSSGAALAAQQGSQARPPVAEQVFKNIQVLKGIPVDDFMDTMGIMSAALGFDCVECHVAAGTDNVNWQFDTDEAHGAADDADGGRD